MHYEQEILVRDAIIEKLNSQIEDLTGQLHRTLCILKIPRLADIAKRRLNFNRIVGEGTSFLEDSNSMQYSLIENNQTLSHVRINNNLGSQESINEVNHQ